MTSTHPCARAFWAYDAAFHDGSCHSYVQVTGTIEFSSHVILSALRNRKHVVAMNAELDATLGPLLKRLADEQGVIFTNSDGDQPGVIINL